MTFPCNSGKYEFEESGGEGVDAYIIDTGISIHHVDFHGRARVGIPLPRCLSSPSVADHVVS